MSILTKICIVICIQRFSKNQRMSMTTPKLIYLPMFQCILGQLDVISRDSPDFALKLLSGVFFIANYKNHYKKFQKNQSRGQNKEFLIFRRGHRHSLIF